MANILVIEDSPDYSELLQNFLKNEGHTVTVRVDGETALALVRQKPFDLMIIDVMLPGMDGVELCSEFRRSFDTPILMLTALDGEAHQLRGFEAQADDYISKTVSMSVLMHKVAAVLRRASGHTRDILVCRGIEMDMKTHRVKVFGRHAELTLREFEILTELMRAFGRVVTRKTLLDKLWGGHLYIEERIVDTHVKNIRKKLGDSCGIETIRGVGYRLSETD